MAAKTRWLTACLGSMLMAFLAMPQLGAADPLDAALTADDVDVASCRSFHKGQASGVDAETLLAALCLPPVARYVPPWCGGRGSDAMTEPETVHYLVVFKKPIPIGSIICSAEKVAILRPEAALPGDPNNPEQWQDILALPPSGKVRVATLPAGAQTRALLFTDTIHGQHDRSELWLARICKARLYNIALQASARAKSEYNAPPAFGSRIYRALDVARGRGPWHSNGKNENGNIVGEFISDDNPCWFVLGWPEAQRIAAIFIQDNFGVWRLSAFDGAEGVDPQIGLASEWRVVSDKRYEETKQHRCRWLSFPEPLTTRGLQWRILKALEQISGGRLADSQVASIENLLVLADLGDQPTPPYREGPPPPPFAIAYTMPLDGTFTMVVDQDNGTRCRNIVARVERKKGEYKEYWDLKDEAGKYVMPGAYRWKGIAAPWLRLRYHFTVYPNVSVHHPENSAWLNGHSGPGGWLADHSPPFGCCASGDRVYFGATCPESGVGFIACDLSGKKLWGIHSFDAWSGAKHMAADGDRVYVENNWGGGGLEDIDRVWVVDVQKQSYRPLLNVSGTDHRRRGIVGMAARQGKLYLAIDGRENWCANAANADMVDIAQCQPFYPEPRKPKRAYEIVPDPRNDFLRLFRLKGEPPGYAKDHGLTWLASVPSATKRACIMLTFKEPVAIGCCVFPVPQGAGYSAKLSAAKHDAPYPPSPSQKSHWQPFVSSGTLAWDVALAPENCRTRALLITFDKGVDELDEAAEAEAAKRHDEVKIEEDIDILDEMRSASRKEEVEGIKENTWQGLLEGMRLLRRRFTNLFGTATVRVNSGEVDKHGVWHANRQEPLSLAKPAIYVVEWTSPQAVRGLAIKEIDGAEARIDVWVGPEQANIPLEGDAHWREMCKYVPRRRMEHPGFAGHNADALYLDDVLDFGEEVKTRAIRIRVVAQWLANTREGSCAKDRLGLDPKRCRIFGVAPLAYAGGEPPIDPLTYQRLEVVNGEDGKIEKEMPLPKPGHIAFAPDSALYAVSAGKIVKVAIDAGEQQIFTADVKAPGPLACDQEHVYVFDAAAERRNIRVYDKAGKFLREIGEAGGYVVGPWTGKRLNQLAGLCVDKESKLWAVDTTYFPKRISCWKTDGTFLREYLGPTCYGGAGVLDPGDRRRLFYGPMEFEIDWQTGASRLKNLTWLPEDGHAAGEVSIRIQGRCYMVTRPYNSANTMACGIVYLYQTDRLKRVAAMGAADAFSPLARPEISARLAGKALAELQFLWCDKNSDGEVQFEECEFKTKKIPALTRFNRDLGIQAGQTRFEVREFLPSGVPIYVEKTVPLPASAAYKDHQWYRLANGNYYKMGVDASQPETVANADGKIIWTYKQEGAGVGPDRTCGPYTPGQVVCQFCIVGHETATAGDLGEFYVINANLGSWNIWTADGLLASRIFRDLRDPKRISWTMREHGRGLALDNVTAGQEHFHGWFCHADDGKYYIVAGHNHASVVEVQGLEDCKRLGATIKITADDIRQAQEWEKEMARWQAQQTARVMDCGVAAEGITVDGDAKEWANIPAATIEPPEGAAPDRRLAFRMCYDAENIYLLYEVRRAGPFKNTGNQWDKLFKTGACVDIMISCDEAADPKRRAPVKGDKRLLLAPFAKGVIAVLYDAVNPEAPQAERWEVASPTGRVEFDSVKRLDDVRAVHRVIVAGQVPDAPIVGYAVEAAVPLAALGLRVKPDMRLRMDWGVLETDEEGAAVLARNYWANKATSTLADAPTEARLEPDMWGWVRFSGKATAGDKAATTGVDDLMRREGTSMEDLDLEE